MPLLPSPKNAIVPRSVPSRRLPSTTFGSVYPVTVGSCLGVLEISCMNCGVALLNRLWASHSDVNLESLPVSIWLDITIHWDWNRHSEMSFHETGGCGWRSNFSYIYSMDSWRCSRTIPETDHSNKSYTLLNIALHVIQCGPWTEPFMICCITDPWIECSLSLDFGVFFSCSSRDNLRFREGESCCCGCFCFALLRRTCQNQYCGVAYLITYLKRGFSSSLAFRPMTG